MRKTLDTLYDGWLEYRKKIKGYVSTPSKADIEDWERFKKTIFDAVEDKKSDGA